MIKEGQMICGIGIDLVENDRLAAIIAKWGSKFLQRVFSEEEIKYCEKHVQAEINYGARFAAKESFLKALGMGLGMGIKLKEIEVVAAARFTIRSRTGSRGQSKPIAKVMRRKTAGSRRVRRLTIQIVVTLGSSTNRLIHCLEDPLRSLSTSTSSASSTTMTFVG